MSRSELIKLIDFKSSLISVRRQCETLGINRSGLYYSPVPISEETVVMMNLLDKQHTKTPFYGVPKMTKYLQGEGYEVGRERVRSLLRKMGIFAIYPKPNLSKRCFDHKIYPYLLKGVLIGRPNQVWSTDITYIRLLRGFVYLVAVIDWFSRYVLSWRLSNSLEACFCVEALREALENYGIPDIFNTDQGAQFTGDDFISCLLEHEIRISMDSKGRAFDNIFIERLWRSVKYEDIYIKGYETMTETACGLRQYFEFYNNVRFHQSLDYKTPKEVYFESILKSGKASLGEQALGKAEHAFVV